MSHASASHLRADLLAGGKVVISAVAAGELTGVLTLTLSPDGNGGYDDGALFDAVTGARRYAVSGFGPVPGLKPAIAAKHESAPISSQYASAFPASGRRPQRCSLDASRLLVRERKAVAAVVGERKRRMLRSNAAG